MPLAGKLTGFTEADQYAHQIHTYIPMYTSNSTMYIHLLYDTYRNVHGTFSQNVLKLEAQISDRINQYILVLYDRLLYSHKDKKSIALFIHVMDESCKCYIE